MINFLPLNDDEPALAHSPMVRAIEKTFSYMARIVAGGSAAMNDITAFWMLDWGGAAMLAAH